MALKFQKAKKDKSSVSIQIGKHEFLTIEKEQPPRMEHDEDEPMENYDIKAVISMDNDGFSSTTKAYLTKKDAIKIINALKESIKKAA